MSYQSLTVKNIVDQIDQNKVFLPAIQRKFVWGKQQITLLFDSLMKNYPIGTFLFWRLNQRVAQDYVFYCFLRKYDQRTPYNERKIGSFTHEEIIGVLDGQQRLSSIFIALQGTHTEKKPYQHANNPSAYEVKSLYLNLLTLPFKVSENEAQIDIDEERNFEFRFLTSHEAQHFVFRNAKKMTEEGIETIVNEEMLWLKVGDIMNWGKDPDIDFKFDKLLELSSNERQKTAIIGQKRFVKKGLGLLYKRLYEDKIINYFEVNNNDLEAILKIFVRVNSGGTILSKTDLLFSTIVATWDEGRDKIEGLLKGINAKGDGFNFNNDFLMRACLVLTDAPVLFKVNSFKSANVEAIKSQWIKIDRAVNITVDILVEFGLNGKLLASANSILIIAYYIIKGGIVDVNTKKEIRKYLVHSFLTGVYGSSQDSLIAVLRNSLRMPGITTSDAKKEFKLKNQRFSFNDMLAVKLPSQKSLKITEVSLESYMFYAKGVNSFYVLSLLYPHLNYSQSKFHQDHIHPSARFDKANFDSINLGEEDRIKWVMMKDQLPNLQFMEASNNMSKNDTSFYDWLMKKDEISRKHFCQINYIPADADIHFADFERFFFNRKELLKKELRGLLALEKPGETQDLVQIELENQDEELTDSENNLLQEIELEL